MNSNGSKPTFLDYRANLKPSSLRANPPSYPAGQRNSAVSTTSSIPSSISAPSLPAAPLSSTGPSVLLYVSGAASPDLASHLNVLLSTQKVSAVHLVGTKDTVLKQLRTDVYTAAGRLRQDVAVSISVAADTETLQRAVAEVGSRGQKVLGALICESDERDQETQSGDLLEMESAALEAVWKSSVLPLHTLLKALLPALSTAAASFQPFLYFDTSIQSPFATASRTALLDSLTTSPLAQNITIGQAAEYLKPAPPVAAETQSMRSLRIDTNGHGGFGGSITPEQSPLFGSESPTKLWASWAAANEI